MVGQYEIALFALSSDGTRLVGRTGDPELVRLIRGRLAADRRRELARLEPPVRLTRSDESDDGQPDDS